MTLQSRLEVLGTALATVTTDCFHYYRAAPHGASCYIVWAEDSEDGALNADNNKVRQGIHATVDYFTKQEYDPNIDTLQGVFANVMGSNWRLNSVQYEVETDFIHYEWEVWFK